ncbi:hypothetical protein OOJ91_34265 [Micromonospora lupini]|uniref:hypothetical protein n=1 Tax=Micromonospora lupini TaxID=285679 RepID=UPI00224D4181|nr:hypothetical protein [Micromonospora lupini]MCX5070915.1 hypothetical protein [Micromonospora lupini]
MLLFMTGVGISLLIAVAAVVLLRYGRTESCCSADVYLNDPHDPGCRHYDVTPARALSHGNLWGVINPAGAVVATAATPTAAQRALRRVSGTDHETANGYRIDLVCPAHPEALHADCDSDTDADLPLILVAEQFAETHGLDPDLRRTCGPCKAWATEEHLISRAHLYTVLAAVNRPPIPRQG